jgi:hypothetical protein
MSKREEKDWSVVSENWIAKTKVALSDISKNSCFL